MPVFHADDPTDEAIMTLRAEIERLREVVEAVAQGEHGTRLAERARSVLNGE